MTNEKGCVAAPSIAAQLNVRGFQGKGFKHPDSCWRDSTAGNKGSRRFLGCIGDNFLLCVIEEPTKRGVLLDLVPVLRSLLGNGKVGGSPGCNNDGMEEFSILRAGKRVKGKTVGLEFPRMCMEMSCSIMPQRDGELLRAGKCSGNTSIKVRSGLFLNAASGWERKELLTTKRRCARNLGGAERHCPSTQC